MTITSVRPGDVVEVDRRGDHFFGVVEEKDRGELWLKPIIPRIKDDRRLVTARDVVAHYRRSRRKGN